MDSVNIPKETEQGKCWTDELLQNIIKEHSGKIIIEQYRWKYEFDRLSYALYLVVEGRSDPVCVPFYRHDLDGCAHEHNTTERNKVKEDLYAVFKTLIEG